MGEGISPSLSRISANTLQKLNEIFLQLTTEKNIQNLLITILSRACELVGAQGGTLLVLTESEGELVFKYRIEDRGENTIVFNEVNLLVQENSLCGYVALTGKVFNLESTHGQKGGTFPVFQKGVDHQQVPQTLSLITLPLKDSRGESRAVLQLCNKLSSGTVIGFDKDDESILKSFVTLAAICLEGSEVYSDVQKLFEGFVRASITAIESRDPSTGGHSERVASMCVALARATTETTTGLYRSVKFREEEIKELEYAALLHDFGKIGIREEVLVKSKKLYTHQLDAIKERIRICKAAARIQCLEETLKKGTPRSLIEQEYSKRVEQIDGYWQLILKANEPNILHQETNALLDQLRSEKLILPDGGEITLLNDEEYLALSVTQGSLTELERLEIESHVRHTYQFLKMIPWTRNFQHLTLLGNRSVICHRKELAVPDNPVFAKWQERFLLVSYRSRKELSERLHDLGAGVCYQIKPGPFDRFLIPGLPNCIHAMFLTDEFHGDRFAYVSGWVSRVMTGRENSFVPHFVPRLKAKRSRRQALGIPPEARVFGRHGGWDTFNISFAHQAVREHARRHRKDHFVFLNTQPIPGTKELSNVHYLPATVDAEEKAEFLATCDAMLHAREMGETFGLAMMEFLYFNKPVLAWENGNDLNHVDVLEPFNLLYNANDVEQKIYELVDRKSVS